jgi:hypothetical protein
VTRASQDQFHRSSGARRLQVLDDAAGNGNQVNYTEAAGDDARHIALRVSALLDL